MALTFAEVMEGLPLIDSLKTVSGEENLPEAEWDLYGENRGKKTASGFAAQTAGKESGGIWKGAINAKELPFGVKLTVGVILGENEQAIQLGWNESAGEVLLILKRSASGVISAFIFLEKVAATVVEKTGKTMAVNDEFGMAFLNKKLVCGRRPSAGAWEVFGESVEETLNAPERPFHEFNPHTKTNVALRYTNFSAGHVAESKPSALAMVI